MVAWSWLSLATIRFAVEPVWKARSSSVVEAVNAAHFDRDPVLSTGHVGSVVTFRSLSSRSLRPRDRDSASAPAPLRRRWGGANVAAGRFAAGRRSDKGSFERSYFNIILYHWHTRSHLQAI